MQLHATRRRSAHCRRRSARSWPPAPSHAGPTSRARSTTGRRPCESWQAGCYEAGYVGRAWPPRVRWRRPPAGRADRRRPGPCGCGGAPALSRRRARRPRPRTAPLRRRRPATPLTSSRSSRPRSSGARASREPEAGSDLASLCMQACCTTPTSFELNGQKTWISWGQFARWCGVLARTDTHGPEAPGHLPPHRRPAVPGRRNAADGANHRLCRVLRLPRRRRSCRRSASSAGPGDGWEIAMRALGHERGTAALPRQVALRTWLDRTCRFLTRRSASTAPGTRRPAAQAHCRALIGIEVSAITRSARWGSSSTAARSGRRARREAPDGRGRAAARRRGARRFAATPRTSETTSGTDVLCSRAASVYGGTQQIQRNIIADRVLALPQ